MNFKELRGGLSVHVLDKGNMTYHVGKVVNCGAPRYPMPNNSTMKNPANFIPQMIVDLTLEIDGKTTTYELPCDQSAHANGNTLFATDKQSILNELHATQRECEEYFAQYDRRKKMREDVSNLIAELDTEFKEKKEMGDRIAKLETNFDKLMSGQDEIMNLLKGMKS